MNISFLKKANPNKIVIIGILLWISLFLLAPLEIKTSFSLEGIFFLILNVLTLFFGIKLISFLNLNKHREYYSNSKKERIFRIVVFLSIICLILKIYDKIYLRGSSFFESTFDNRDSFEQGSSNYIAIIHSLLTGFSYLPLFLYSFFGKKNKIIFIVCHVIFFSSVLDIFLIGSRSTTLLSFFIYIFYLLVFQKKIRKIRLFFFSFLTLLIGLWMGVILIERSKEFAGDDVINYILTGAGFTEVIGPSESWVNSIKYLDFEIGQTILISYTTLINYYIHGIIEFLYVYDNFNANHTLGQYTFFIYYKFINIVIGNGNPSFIPIALVNPRPAVYTSFYGPIYFDFGWFSLFFSFFLGMISSYVHKKAVYGDIGYIVIYSYIANLLFFIPVFNFFEGAAGLYVLTSFFIFKIINKII